MADDKKPGGFWHSGLINNLTEGKLPDVNINFVWDTESMIDTCVGLLIVGLAILIVHHFIKKLA